MGVWLKSSASAVCIITLKALTRADEAGFSIYFFFFPNGKIYQPNFSDYDGAAF